MCLIEFVDSDESAATVQDNSAELAEA